MKDCSRFFFFYYYYAFTRKVKSQYHISIKIIYLMIFMTLFKFLLKHVWLKKYTNHFKNLLIENYFE